MDSLQFVNSLRDTLWHIEQGHGHVEFYVVHEEELLTRLRDHAYQLALVNNVNFDVNTYVYDEFVGDLLNRDRFAQRIRYCIIKLQEFAIPKDKYFEFLKQTIEQVESIQPNKSKKYTSSASIEDLLIWELVECFRSYYYPTDIALYDFATEHQLIRFDHDMQNWKLTGFGRYSLQLSVFDLILFICTLEIAFNNRNGRRYLNKQMLSMLLDPSKNLENIFIPFILKKLGLVSDGHDSLTLTPIGSQLLQLLHDNLAEFENTVLLLGESEVIGFAYIPDDDIMKRIEKTTQQSANITEVVKKSIADALKLLTQGNHLDGLNIIYINIERLCNQTLQKLGRSEGEINNLRGLQGKINTLEKEGVLTSKQANWAIVVTARNKMVHGNIRENNADMLKPMVDIVGQVWVLLMTEIDEFFNK